MLIDRYNHILMEGLTDDGGGGGGSGGDGGTGGGDGGKGNEVSLPDLPENWTQGLPDELKGEASLSAYRTVGDLAKAMVHARKMVGANKVAVPGKHATDEDWSTFFQAVGKPADIDSYGKAVTMPEGSEFQEGFAEKLTQKAFELNIMPYQLTGLVDWIYKTEKEAQEALVKSQDDKSAEDLKVLKGEWGEKYQANLNRAQSAFKVLAEKVEGAWDWMDESGLSSHPMMLKLFSLVGDQLKEGGIIGDDGGGGKQTPREVQEEINAILGDAEHPYNVKEHPNHDGAVRAVNELFAKLHGNQPVQRSISI